MSSSNPSSTIAPAMMPPREILHDSLSLSGDTDSELHYSFAIAQNEPPHPPAQSTKRPKDYSEDRYDDILIIFLNGLMSTKSTWLPVIADIIRRCKAKNQSGGFPTMLAYDRPGQGLTTARDVRDGPRPDRYGHDCNDAADDLAEFIPAFVKKHMDTRTKPFRLMFVANSIGCAIARLCNQKILKTMSCVCSAFLFLDSIIANSNFDFYPDPESSDFDPANDLPNDVSVQVLVEQRRIMHSLFDPAVKNPEGLDRRCLASQLPYPDRPRLQRVADTSEDQSVETRRRLKTSPWLTVVGHDFDVFARESFKSIGAPPSLTNRYTNAIWHKYNNDLALLTDSEYSKGPIQAPGCSHFIQRDNPEFVADELLDLLNKVISTG